VAQAWNFAGVVFATVMPAAPLPSSRALAVLGVLAAPYLLNDLANIYVRAPAAWLACDYGSRVVSLGGIAWLLRRGTLERSDLQVQLAPLARLVAATLGATLLGLWFDQGPGRPLVHWLPQTQLGAVPFIRPPWLHELDYFAGLAFVAATEELVFRGIFPRVITRAGGSAGQAWAVSAVAFGLAHWSLGVGAMVHAAALGLLLGAAARLGRSVWPAVVAHYAIDLAAFG